MNKGTLANGPRPAGQQWGLVLAALALTALVAGALGWAAAWQVGTWAEAGATAPVTAPQRAVEHDAGAAAAMSQRALSQHRAFYAQQMASEAALEQWSLPQPAGARASAASVSAAQRAFYAQQMASEAALEGWSAPGRELPLVETEQPAPQVVNGLQFK